MDITVTTNTNTNNTNSRTITGITTTIGGANNGDLSITPFTKIIPLTNGVLKRHKHHHALPGGGVTYKECLKNHAASLGGHALDGCGEFMPAPSATTANPSFLKCAACGCHRNFHRRDLDQKEAVGDGTQVVEYHPQHRHHPLPPPVAHLSTPPEAVATCQVRSPGSEDRSPPPISSSYYPGSATHTLLALSGGGGNIPGNNTTTTNQHHMFNTSLNFPTRKRFRTKFSQVQKNKMHEFAEKVGWKMLKSNDDLVNGFCNEIGVERGVFKVWMHNNKNTIGKRSGSTNYVISANHVGISVNNTNNPVEEDEDHVNENGVGNSNSSSINNSQANGSSSSS